MKDRLQSQECSQKLKALADADRLKIVECLQRGPRNVSALAETLGEPIGSVSHHLGVLRAAGLVSDERQGRHIIYSLHPSIYRQHDKSSDLEVLDFGCCQFVLGNDKPQ
jgi:DNA-binding transcriptional ArsR family regulator